eukprot:scaffold9496_cov135-Isochrysis_galbana.AAC.2
MGWHLRHDELISAERLRRLPQEPVYGANVDGRSLHDEVWYAAKVLARRGHAGKFVYNMHFKGWLVKVKHDEQLGADRLRQSEITTSRPAYNWGSTVGQLDDGSWQVENVVKRRRRNHKYEYLIKWDGWYLPDT